MSNTVTIVTAFVDLGRDKWEGVKNGEVIPPYIKRDVDTYFKRFERLTKLKNPIICFTEKKFFDRIRAMRDSIILIDVGDIFKDHEHLIKSITEVQQHPSFIKFVTRPSAPEYWSPEYVAINFMKSHLVDYAVTQGWVTTGAAAWIDFGYVRDDTYCPPGMEWKFNDNKQINIFSISPYLTEKPIFEIVRNGDVYIQGCHIVAPTGHWNHLKQLMNENLSTLFRVGLIDDDQTLLLMSYRQAPELFKLNMVNPADWFVIFKDFHHD